MHFSRQKAWLYSPQLNKPRPKVFPEIALNKNLTILGAASPTKYFKLLTQIGQVVFIFQSQ